MDIDGEINTDVDCLSRSLSVSIYMYIYIYIYEDMSMHI